MERGAPARLSLRNHRLCAHRAATAGRPDVRDFRIERNRTSRPAGVGVVQLASGGGGRGGRSSSGTTRCRCWRSGARSTRRTTACSSSPGTAACWKASAPESAAVCRCAPLCHQTRHLPPPPKCAQTRAATNRSRVPCIRASSKRLKGRRLTFKPGCGPLRNCRWALPQSRNQLPLAVRELGCWSAIWPRPLGGRGSCSDQGRPCCTNQSRHPHQAATRCPGAAEILGRPQLPALLGWQAAAGGRAAAAGAGRHQRQRPHHGGRPRGAPRPAHPRGPAPGQGAGQHAQQNLCLPAPTRRARQGARASRGAPTRPGGGEHADSMPSLALFLRSGLSDLSGIVHRTDVHSSKVHRAWQSGGHGGNSKHFVRGAGRLQLVAGACLGAGVRGGAAGCGGRAPRRCRHWTAC